MRRRVLGVRTGIAATIMLLLGACTASAETEPSSSGSPSDSADASASALDTSAGAAGLRLSTATVKSRVCRTDRRDLLNVDFSWHALQDLDEFSVSLVSARGVDTRGSGLTIPPVNFGGRIDQGGDALWVSRSDIDSPMIRWSERDRIWAKAPLEGESGLVGLHLIFGDGDEASFEGLSAEWTAEDGTTGTVQIDGKHTYRFKKSC